MLQRFYVGSYTNSYADEEALGQGVYSCVTDLATGQIEVLGHFAMHMNPSYLAINNKRSRLCAIQEYISSTDLFLHAFNINSSFSLDLINTVPIPGAIACHLALDQEAKFLSVATYMSGTVLLYSLTDEGYLIKLEDEVRRSGSSINSERQSQSHPHSTVFSPNSRTVFVTDLGTDEICAYEINRKKLDLLTTLTMPPGSGPRHLTFHPNGGVAFVVNELNSSLDILAYEGSRLSLVNSVSTLPVGAASINSCAAVRVHKSGNFVYVSNRGHDSLSVFSYETATNKLNLVQNISSGGRTPRDFALTSNGRILVVANKDTNTLVSYWVDTTNGLIEPTGYSTRIGTPACILMS